MKDNTKTVNQEPANKIKNLGWKIGAVAFFIAAVVLFLTPKDNAVMAIVMLVMALVSLTYTMKK